MLLVHPPPDLGVQLSQYWSVIRIGPPEVAMTAEDPAPRRTGSLEEVLSDSRPLLRILRLTRPTAGMLLALVRPAVSKCRTLMSWAPHTSVALTPLLRRMFAREALIGQLSLSRSPWAAHWGGSAFCYGAPCACFRSYCPERVRRRYLSQPARLLTNLNFVSNTSLAAFGRRPPNLRRRPSEPFIEADIRPVRLR
jgi:hypothetical protein